MHLLDHLQQYQLNIMMALSWICGLLTFFVAITKTLAPKRKGILMSLELCSTILLVSERFAIYYQGNTSHAAYWIVRISNFFVFLLTIVLIFIFTLYLIDVFCKEGGFARPPARLRGACVLCGLAVILLLFSQFTGFYYTFDAQNYYQRADGFLICYLFPLIILVLNLSVILEHYKRVSKLIRISLLLFSIVPLVSSIVQLFVYGISLISMTLVGLAVELYVFALLDMNDVIARANRREIEIVRQEQQNMQRMFEQTATALANSIDAKDKYTHGHSRRVAEYAVKVARSAGKSEKECEEIYYAGLLHDVGKIGISDSIINKDGKLTDEEYAVIKTHPAIGMQILSGISQSPYLSIGAHYHHERYDGRGYPDGLKGEDIPDIARIIAVADAYDAMTSKRSYRDPIPQQFVREEFVKGTGTQFDPNYAKIMIHLIDLDSEYQMKERGETNELEGEKALVCGSLRSAVSDGILLTDEMTHIHLSTRMNDLHDPAFIPTFVLFDSMDGRYHSDERRRRDLLFFEYGSIRADGQTEISGARNIQTEESDAHKAGRESHAFLHETVEMDLYAVRYKDHLLIRMTTAYRSHRIIMALPDSTRFCYLSLTGDHCTIDDVDITKTGEKIGEGYIPRIAEEISYINAPAGDIPNVQVDGWRSAASEAIEVTDGMRIRFHTMSLPTAHLIWHCPFAVLFTSADGIMHGKEYRELTVIRLDGEGWEEDNAADNQVQVAKLPGFTDWKRWKDMNKAGQDCELCYSLGEGTVTITAEFCDLSVRSVTTYTGQIPKIYTALTGDQVALTNIRVIR